MKVLNKVTKDASKYAFQFPHKGSSAVISHDIAAALIEMGFIKGRMLLVDPQVEERFDITTNASVGYRVVGFDSTLANDLIKIGAEKDAKLATLEQETKLNDLKVAAAKTF